MDQAQTDELVTKAAAKIIWGDSAEEVRGWLMQRGFSAAQADHAVKQALQERTDEVRRRAANGLWLGGGIFLVGALPIFLMWRVHVLNLYVTIACGTVAFMGLFRLMSALSLMASGSSARGSTTDMDS